MAEDFQLICKTLEFQHSLFFRTEGLPDYDSQMMTDCYHSERKVILYDPCIILMEGFYDQKHHNKYQLYFALEVLRDDRLLSGKLVNGCNRNYVRRTSVSVS